MRDPIALFTVGAERFTRLTSGRPNTEATLESMARIVAGKNPNKSYYVFEVRDSDWNRRRVPLYVWHVGEGFAHEDGWWVDA